MWNNKGSAIPFILLLMTSILVLLSAVLKLESVGVDRARINDNKLKAYYMAEAGVYYTGETVLKPIPPSETTTIVESPKVDEKNVFYEQYNQPHGFIVTITKQEELNKYKIDSVGTYNGQTQRIEAVAEINGELISYSQMKKIVLFNKTS